MEPPQSKKGILPTSVVLIFYEILFAYKCYFGPVLGGTEAADSVISAVAEAKQMANAPFSERGDTA